MIDDILFQLSEEGFVFEVNFGKVDVEAFDSKGWCEGPNGIYSATISTTVMARHGIRYTFVLGGTLQ